MLIERYPPVALFAFVPTLAREFEPRFRLFDVLHAMQIVLIEIKIQREHADHARNVKKPHVTAPALIIFLDFGFASRTVLVASTATARDIATATAETVASALLFLRANLRNRYPADGGHACTVSSAR